MVVTGARLSPVQNLPTGTSITYYLSNEDPASWQVAAACTDNASDRCATFPKPVGRTVRWKAVACSDSTRTRTPTITSLGVKFDYTPAREHYRAGVIVSDGVAYVGAFRQPGERGHFYAINAGLSTKYWDFATKLNAMPDSSRNLYTATTDGMTRLPFTAAMASDARMQATLGVGSTDQAAAIIQWVREKRFGYTSTTLAQSKLGAVEASTPAVLTAPGLPSWYVHASPAARQEVDQFLVARSKRPQLVFFGSKDGMLHAVRTIPTSITHANSGAEVWAFIPPRVAFGFSADRAASAATSYPDGSPSLADVRIGGQLRTVAIVNGGNGSRGVFALDVTDTYAIANSNDATSATTAVAGPTPLWHALPGDSNAGQSYAKAAIARVKVSGAEKYLAIMASGRASENASAPWTKGREVIAVDIATGGTSWSFTARCPVTSDVVIFETDDDAETGTPEIDGYADRVVFADYCGYVYKLPLGTAPTAGRLVGLGAVSTGATDGAGNPIKALFSVATSSGGLGSERPIAGTIGARADATGRVALFFGTGGDEQFDVTKQNAFYAIYADSGAVRSKLLGTCVANRCDKFYGGVVVTAEQVFMTRAKDPPVGTTVCDFGNSALVALKVNDANGSFTTDFTTTLSSTTQASLFGDAGALYLATLSGDIVRVGTPRAATAGGDSSAGNAPGGADGAGAGGNVTGDPVSFLGWRQMI
jgi:Tfp pilus tip-associated adhesin PilY1